MRKDIAISLLKQILAIGIVAYAFIVIAVYVIPHLPLANRRTFHVMLHAQMTLEHEKEASQEKKAKGDLLFLGSSVVERGVDEKVLDSILVNKHLGYYTTNSGAGGFFAKANLAMLRTMLEHGLHPARVVYGVFLQELNGKSAIHNDLSGEDTSSLQFREKTFLNTLRYGPISLSSMLDGPNIHIYLFVTNNAFRGVRDPNFFQRLSFGENLYERDSNFVFNPDFFRDLQAICLLCKEKNIPFAFFNSPIRPKVESLADLPYLHRLEAYRAVEQFAVQEDIPLWNFDKAGFFENGDFLDSYHLTAGGAKKLTVMVASKIEAWQKGFIEQDVTTPSADGIRNEIKDSLIRTVFHF